MSDWMGERVIHPPPQHELKSGEMTTEDITGSHLHCPALGTLLGPSCALLFFFFCLLLPWESQSVLQSAITYIIDSKYIYRLLLGLWALTGRWLVGVSYGSRGVFVNDKVTFHEDKEEKMGRVWESKEELATSRQTDDIIHQQRLGRDQQQ